MQSIEKLKDIPKKKYQGYVWYSDKSTPMQLYGDIEYAFTEDKLNPFVVEAMLFCKEENISIMVRHTGKYYITQYDLKNLPEGASLVPKKYLPHRLKDISNICFQQLWVPELDCNCEDMEVLTLKAVIFNGFDNQPSLK